MRVSKHIWQRVLLLPVALVMLFAILPAIFFFLPSVAAATQYRVHETAVSGVNWPGLDTWYDSKSAACQGNGTAWSDYYHSQYPDAPPFSYGLSPDENNCIEYHAGVAYSYWTFEVREITPTPTLTTTPTPTSTITPTPTVTLSCADREGPNECAKCCAEAHQRRQAACRGSVSCTLKSVEMLRSCQYSCIP